MIDRQSMGFIPPKPHTVHRAPDGSLLYEEMFTRAGFEGPFTYMYHRHAPTPARKVEATSRGFAIATLAEEGLHPVKRRLYDANRSWSGDASMKGATRLIDQRVPILFNADLTIWLASPSEADDAYFANNDGDELWYLKSGSARIETQLGWLDVKQGDYVHIPRSIIHRWHPATQLELLGIEAHNDVGVPQSFRNAMGQLTMNAPYTHRDFVRPVGPLVAFDGPLSGPDQLLVKKQDRFTLLTLERSPMDVVGWDGFVYPFAFDILKYQPRAGLIHLPPTVHMTFAGVGYVICSFVPRMTDFHENAIPCPYPHSNVQCDEVLLYLDGNFTSRKGVGPGSISLHPSGVVHGPHPGAYERSIGAKSTTETAVMIDTFKPLMPTKQAMAIENGAYHDSWQTM